MGIRVLLADDHNIFRESLRSLLERHGMQVVAEAEDGRRALALAKQHSLDVVIMDIGMPVLNGIEATRQILSVSPTVKVIALSMHSDRHYVIGMLKAGASGYLLKDCACEELTHAIHEVLARRIFLSPRLADTILKDYINRVPEEEFSGCPRFTKRELEVLQLFTEGRTTAQIATSLFLSIKTVESHRQKIMDITGMHSIAELTKYAIREGLISLEN
jgi:two-component system response regulator NreC